MVGYLVGGLLAGACRTPAAGRRLGMAGLLVVAAVVIAVGGAGRAGGRPGRHARATGRLRIGHSGAIRLSRRGPAGIRSGHERAQSRGPGSGTSSSSTACRSTGA